MKIVDFDWSAHFKPYILRRGKAYFEEGRVGQIRYRDTTYYAYVEGTWRYGVEVTIEDGGIKELYCDCPYAETDNCKHMAAVLFGLEEENISFEELPVAPVPPAVSRVPQEMPWAEAIDHLPEAVVRNELLKRAEQEDWLKERLAVLYLGGLPAGQIQNWKADLQEKASRYINRRGWIMGEDAWEFTEDLGNLVTDHLPILLEVNAVMDAFGLVWIVMETALEWCVENDDDCIDDLMDDCEEALRKIYAGATEDQRTKMIRWYQEHRNPEWPGGVELMDHIFQALALENVPIRGTVVMKFVNDVPCFLFEDEWIVYPKRGGFYYDFVEDTAFYKEIAPIVEARIKEELGDHYDSFGACHEIWQRRKQLLMELYGVSWYTPAELNPQVLFD